MPHELTPYLAVPDARAAIDWYAQVLGAEVTVEPIVMPDGRVGHVELDADGAHWMMADAHPEIRSPAPTPGEGSPVTLHLTVADVDATTERARAAGADVDREPGDNPGIGRIAVFRDPFGHRWMLNQPVD
jgi:PhnB protein